MGDNTSRDSKRMHLSVSDVKALLAVYLVFLVLGLLIVVSAIVNHSVDSPDPGTAVIYCACMSLVGTSIYYTRKLYKALINDDYTFTSDFPLEISTEIRLKRIGTLAFFVFRPLFGVAFSVLVYVLWRLSLSASGAEEVKPTTGFFFTTLSLGFVSGFLAGRLLTMLEGYGNRRLSGILGAEE